MDKIVSIIVPVFNTEERLLESCINSLCEQTYERIEIIIVDDGSQVSTSIALTPEANDILLKVMKLDDSMKANTTINKVLETCYNPETKTFKQEIPVKDVSSNINYSVQISKKHRDALAKEAKKRNMTVGEYLSELVLRTIKFN